MSTISELVVSILPRVLCIVALVTAPIALVSLALRRKTWSLAVVLTLLAMVWLVGGGFVLSLLDTAGLGVDAEKIAILGWTAICAFLAGFAVYEWHRSQREAQSLSED